MITTFLNWIALLAYFYFIVQDHNIMSQGMCCLFLRHTYRLIKLMSTSKSYIHYYIKKCGDLRSLAMHSYYQVFLQRSTREPQHTHIGMMCAMHYSYCSNI